MASWMRIPLTQGQSTVVDVDDFLWLSKWKWHWHSLNNHAASVSPSRAFMHRLITGAAGKDEIVDHMNGDTLDNRRSNLRICTKAENGRHRVNMNKNNTTGFRGVVKHRDKWVAQIKVDRKHIYLGIFSTPEEAAQCYKEAALKYFGDYKGIV